MRTRRLHLLQRIGIGSGEVVFRKFGEGFTAVRCRLLRHDCPGLIAPFAGRGRAANAVQRAAKTSYAA